MGFLSGLRICCIQGAICALCSFSIVATSSFMMSSVAFSVVEICSTISSLGGSTRFAGFTGSV